MVLDGKRIILGVSGGIAAYKAVFILRQLQEKGADIQVVMTPSACKFVTPLTFSTLSKKPVFIDLWDDKEDYSAHVHLAHQADIILIAPCTANTLAKLTNGICDNALIAVTMSAKCPVIIAPAMDNEMYDFFAVQKNIEILSSNGFTIIPPETGYLASGIQGKGRLAEIETIVETVVEKLSHKLFYEINMLITAGPTRENIDPVRFISNYSTGKMGYALAKMASQMGALVTLITGPTNIKPPLCFKVVAVNSAEEMFQAVQNHYKEQQIHILTAAVADFKTENIAQNKLKKKGNSLDIHFVPTVDILSWLGENKPNSAFLVGFALETDNELENAKAKLIRKKLDLIVLNSLNHKNTGFGYDTNQVTLIEKSGKHFDLPLMSKTMVAQKILEHIYHLQQDDSN